RRYVRLWVEHGQPGSGNLALQVAENDLARACDEAVTQSDLFRSTWAYAAKCPPSRRETAGVPSPQDSLGAGASPDRWGWTPVRKFVTSGLVLAVVVTLLASAGWASGTPLEGRDPTSTSNPLPAATRAKVERIVRQFQDTNHTPGVLVGIWSPKGTFVSATGVADQATGTPLSPDMQFKIGSQTKSFTESLILQLVGEGKVSLDDHISKWVAGGPTGDQITIRQVLNMTSGLGPGLLATEGGEAKLATGCTPDDVLAAGASQPPTAPPGTKWVYSNYGIDLLGRVVELTTGQDLSTAI